MLIVRTETTKIQAKLYLQKFDNTQSTQARMPKLRNDNTWSAQVGMPKVRNVDYAGNVYAKGGKIE